MTRNFGHVNLNEYYDTLCRALKRNIFLSLFNIPAFNIPIPSRVNRKRLSRPKKSKRVSACQKKYSQLEHYFLFQIFLFQKYSHSKYKYSYSTKFQHSIFCFHPRRSDTRSVDKIQNLTHFPFCYHLWFSVFCRTVFVFLLLSRSQVMVKSNLFSQVFQRPQAGHTGVPKNPKTIENTYC